MRANEKLEIEFVDEKAVIKLNGETLEHVDKIEIEQTGKISVVRIRQVYVVGEMNIIGKPTGNYLYMESDGKHIEIGINH